MDLHSNKYITTMVDIIGTAITIGIMRIGFIATVIGIITKSNILLSVTLVLM